MFLITAKKLNKKDGSAYIKASFINKELSIKTASHDYDYNLNHDENLIRAAKMLGFERSAVLVDVLSVENGILTAVFIDRLDIAEKLEKMAGQINCDIKLINKD